MNQNTESEKSVVNATITSLCLGLLSGFSGTMYHTYLWYISGSSLYIPWGSLLAVFLVFLACLWSILHWRMKWTATVVGIVAFVEVGFFAFSKAGSVLVLVNPQVPVGVAGTLWILGTLVAVILAQLLSSIYLKRTAPKIIH